ncbi:hypothetical protein [Pseudomonas graminis]
MNYGTADISTLDINELCDQCRALAFAITELTDPIARDIMTWILVERVDMLSLRFESEEVVLELA